MKSQIPSSIALMTAKRNKKNAATTLLCANNLEKLITTNKRGEAKKKLALVTDRYKICKLFRTLKATMNFFSKTSIQQCKSKRSL